MPINKIPPETLALVATFFEPGRQLVNATAVCQYWRATLLSSPRLWNRINCKTRAMFEKYLRRSKSVPLEVQLRNTSLGMLELLAPHVSRLSSLTLVMHNPSGLEQLARHLGNPIPTLNEFGIIAKPRASELSLRFGIKNDHFLHVKKLRLVHVSFLRVPHALFPRVTELEWIARPRNSPPLSGLLETLVELPTLERVEIEFQGFSRSAQITPTRLVTLPNVHRMSLQCSGGDIPSLLESLKLSSLTSLVVGGVRNTQRPFSIIPTTLFGENIPNFAQLPEMEVFVNNRQIKVSFRSHSQAKLDYYIEPRPLGRGCCGYYRTRWGGLPVDSIRKLVVYMRTTDDGWIVGMLRDLRLLEHLEFRSHCGNTPRYLRSILGGNSFPEMKTLTVYCGSKREARQVDRLQDVVGGLDSGISVAWVKDSEIPVTGSGN